MKLVDLNLWGGRISEKYKEFFEAHRDADIFCFQEVFHNADSNHHINVTGFEPDLKLHDFLRHLLPEMRDEFMQVHKEVYGLSTFLSKNIRVIEKGEVLIARGVCNDEGVVRGSNEWDHHRKLQWFELEVSGKRFLLANAHLTHRPEGKRDSEKRLKQSDRIVDFLSMFSIPKILIGDFNLLPDTESIVMIERSGMRNLIKEYGITSTRTELYAKPLRFADYAFVSPEVKVTDFKVLPDTLSDHAPLCLEFEL